MATTTNLDTLKINYLTQSQYDTALANSQINTNELYFTPGVPTPTADEDPANKAYVDSQTVVAGENVSIAINLQGKREVSVEKPVQAGGDSLNGDYRLLLSDSANSSEDYTYNSYKSTYLTFNPNSSLLKIGSTSTTYSAILSGNPTYTEGLVFANSTSSTTGQYESHFGPRGLQVFNAGDNNGQPNPDSTTADAQSHTVVYGGGIGVMNNSTWATSTNGTYIFGGKATAGSIELKNGSTTAKTITTTKIDNWDNHIANNSSVTAQTTQKVYPIKIDSKGHISAYGTGITASDIVTLTGTQTLSNKGLSAPSISSNLIFDSDGTSTCTIRGIRRELTNGTNITYTMTAGSAYLLMITGYSTTSDYTGLYIINANSGNSAVGTVKASSKATVTVSGTTLTIAPTATLRAYLTRFGGANG